MVEGYFSFPRLCKAAALAVPITLMAVPRIVIGGLDRFAAIAVAFMAMTLIVHFALTWQRSAGMAGMFPARRVCLAGIAVAALLGSLLLLIRLVWLDPVYKYALTRGGEEAIFVLRYPDTAAGALALVLWATGFETVFFLAGAVSFFARLTRRSWAAVVGAVAVRMLVTWLQLSLSAAPETTPLFMVGVAAATAIGALIYMRAGLPAAMVFSAIVSARPLTPPPGF